MSSSVKRKPNSNQAGPSNGTSKRTRFDESQNRIDDDGEDTIGDLDIEEQDRKRLQQGRKGRVVTDGYDSEGSSDDDDGEEDNEKVVDDEVDEDEDMFNPKEDDTINANGKGKTTSKGDEEKKFLSMDDIEGQEFSDDEDEGEKEDAELELEEEEEVEGDSVKEENLHDPEAVVKPLHNGKSGNSKGEKEMGFKIESFNMKNEMATGRFDEEGNYIANAKDPHAEHDKWLTGNYNRKNIAAAKEAQERRMKEAEKKEKDRENAQLDEDECKMELTKRLKRGESVLNALQRLGGQQKKLKREGNRHDEVKSELEKVTSLASELMSRYGLVNIYDSTYERLLDDVRKSGLVRSTWDPAAENENEKKPSSYVYKWSPSYLQAMGQSEQEDQQQQIFGPFPIQDLLSWKQDGYFGDSGERILLKSNDDRDTVWSSWQDLFG